MIKFSGLTKRYTTKEIETTVLEGIDLEICEGDFVAIMGPSGSGKTSLLSILGLLDSFTSGEYDFLNQNVAESTSREKAEMRKKNIGFVFQSFNLISNLSVYDNVELPLVYQGVNKPEREAIVNKALEKMGIIHRKNHRPSQLSGGQQQRVAVARAVVGSPKIILADEPTGNLDSKNGKEVMELFKNLNDSGTTIVMVTHSEFDAGFASKIIRLSDGSLAA